MTCIIWDRCINISKRYFLKSPFDISLTTTWKLIVAGGLQSRCVCDHQAVWSLQPDEWHGVGVLHPQVEQQHQVLVHQTELSLEGINTRTNNPSSFASSKFFNCCLLRLWFPYIDNWMSYFQTDWLHHRRLHHSGLITPQAALNKTC